LRPATADPGSGTSNRLPRPLFALVTAVSTTVISVFAVAPRFVLWRGLQIPEARHNPEVNRAKVMLQLLDNPWMKVTQKSNDAVNWRPFFPVLGHFLHLPPAVYLALAHLGALVLLAAIALLVENRTQDRKLAFLATLLCATTSWFFVSLGWLGYFDAWMMLGILAVSFTRRRWVLVAACVVIPLIDERFIFMLPLCMFIRWQEARARNEQERAKPEVLLCLALGGLYVAGRLILFALGAEHGSSHESEYSFSHSKLVYYPGAILRGLWHGLRTAWVFGGIAIAQLLVLRPRIVGVAFACTLLLVLAVTFNFSGDFSRSVSMLLPLVILGILLQHERSAHTATGVLALCAALNLVLPARIVMATFDEPLHSLPVEIANLQHPPPVVDPKVYLENGIASVAAGNSEDAIRSFNNAILLDPQDPVARVRRGLSYLQGKQFDPAIQDFQTALTLGKGVPALERQVQSALDQAIAAKSVAGKGLRTP
jgi:tetratricopeptide (TPR) repeat protein